MSSDPFSTGVSALEAYSTAIDVAANNIANVGTAGFQGEDTEFGDIYTGAVAARLSANAAQGGLQPTGSATNVAIAGTGYFALEGPNGTIYTRDGNFVPGGNATLVDASTGLAVSSVSGAPIVIPAGTSVLSIGADGTVTAILNGQPTMLGRIALATFSNPGGLLHVSGGYQVSPNSGHRHARRAGNAGLRLADPGFSRRLERRSGRGNHQDDRIPSAYKPTRSPSAPPTKSSPPPSTSTTKAAPRSR